MPRWSTNPWAILQGILYHVRHVPIPGTTTKDCIHSLYSCLDWMMRFMQHLRSEPDPESMYYTDDVLPLQEAF